MRLAELVVITCNLLKTLPVICVIQWKIACQTNDQRARISTGQMNPWPASVGRAAETTRDEPTVLTPHSRSVSPGRPISTSRPCANASFQFEPPDTVLMVFIGTVPECVRIAMDDGLSF